MSKVLYRICYSRDTTISTNASTPLCNTFIEIGGSAGGQPGNYNDIHATNPTAKQLLYIAAFWVHSTGDTAGVTTSVGWTPDNVNSNESWMLHNTGGTPGPANRAGVTAGNGIFWMDPGNAAFRTACAAHILTIYNNSALGGPWDGIFFDGVITSLSDIPGGTCQEYPNAVTTSGSGVPAFQTAVTGWLTSVCGALTSAGVPYYVGNIDRGYAFPDTDGASLVWKTYMGSGKLNGAMEEGYGCDFVSDASGAFAVPAMTKTAAWCRANSRDFYGHTYARRTTAASPWTVAREEELDYLTGLILLTHDPTATFNGGAAIETTSYTVTNPTVYPDMISAGASLGAPSGARVDNGDGTFSRTFADGNILVNTTGGTLRGVPSYSSLLTITTVTPPTIILAPSATGTTALGDTLSCTTGIWSGSPSSYTYQWQRGGVNIAAATAATHVIVSADQGTTVRCVVTATNTGGSTASNSNGILVPAAAGTVPVNTVLPVLSGSQSVGGVLTCSTGTWTGSPSPTFAYQWQRDIGAGLVNIGGATSATYTLLQIDFGTRLVCVVTATNTSGSVPAATKRKLALAARKVLVDENNQIAAAELFTYYRLSTANDTGFVLQPGVYRFMMRAGGGGGGGGGSASTGIVQGAGAGGTAGTALEIVQRIVTPTTFTFTMGSGGPLGAGGTAGGAGSAGNTGSDSRLLATAGDTIDWSAKGGRGGSGGAGSSNATASAAPYGTGAVTNTSATLGGGSGGLYTGTGPVAGGNPIGYSGGGGGAGAASTASLGGNGGSAGGPPGTAGGAAGTGNTGTAAGAVGATAAANTGAGGGGGGGGTNGSAGGNGGVGGSGQLEIFLVAR